MSQLYQLLERAIRLGASDLHIQTGACPRLRLQGELVSACDEEDAPPLTRRQVDQMLLPLLEQEQRDALQGAGSLDFAYTDPRGQPWRAHFFRHFHGLGAVLRPLRAEAPTLAELRLPEQLERFTHLSSGLVLVIGHAGAGKSTTLAALIGLLSRTYRKVIVTLEAPVEYHLPDEASLVHQREVGVDVPSLEQGIRDAMRERPDVLAIGELWGGDAIRLALEAAEAGILVFAALDALHPAQALRSLLEALPEEEEDFYREKLATGLQGLVGQVLLPVIEGKGRAVACEVLFRTPGLAGLVRADKLDELRDRIKAGRDEGMVYLDEGLGKLVSSGAIRREDALRFAVEPRWLPGGADRRAAPPPRIEQRMAVRQLVSIHELDGDGHPTRTTMGRTADLSSRGARVELDRAIEAGTRVRLSMALEAKMLEVEATVRSCEGLAGERHAVGLRFDELRPDAAQVLDEFLTLNG